MVVVAVDKAQLGHVARTGGPAVYGVQHARRGGGGVLRVQRQNQDAGGALGLEGVKLAGDRRIAVAHGMAHQHVVPGLAQPAAQQRGLFGSPHRQGRALGGPHAGVFFGGFGRPGAQDDAVQDGPPDQPRNLDHPVVAQKVGKIPPHGRSRGLVGGSQVAQQHGSALGLAVGIGRFGLKRHAAFSRKAGRVRRPGLFMPLRSASRPCAVPWGQERAPAWPLDCSQRDLQATQCCVCGSIWRRSNGMLQPHSPHRP